MARALAVLLVVLMVASGAPALPQGTSAVEADAAAGIRQVQEGDFEGAVVTLEGVASRLKGDAPRKQLLVQVDVQRGVAQVALDHPDLAVQAFLEALALDPQLRLGTERFSPKVLGVFQKARDQAAQRSANRAPRHSGARTALLVGGGAAAAAAGIALATRGGEPQVPTFASARFLTPVLECPNGSDNIPLPFTVLVDVQNPDKESLAITAVTTVAIIVASATTSEINFASTQPSTATPASVAANGTATLQVQSALVCGNGFGDPARFNEWMARMTFVTSAGAFTVETSDRMRVNIP